MNTTSLDSLTTILTGVAGEYFVAAELSRRGYVASVTLRNTRGMDVIATNADASRSVGISVKTNKTNKKDWMVNEQAESFQSETLFYVFVNLKGVGENPSYHVVPSKVVATSVYESHRAWLSGRKKSGDARKDSSMRRFTDPECKYEDRWDLLGLDFATQPEPQPTILQRGPASES